ncbi:MAG TPA: lytic transglycosylase domain-containing protein, partial [Rhizomicrobium sp.]|nr:lytic transglycosylase domain-containing protein [Rhizomicrobium sp.]
ATAAAIAFAAAAGAQNVPPAQISIGLGDDEAQPPERRNTTVHYLSASDHALYVKAFDAADRKDWQDAQAFALQAQDIVARHIIEWRYLTDRNSGATFTEIDAFIRNHSDWPLQSVLQSRAEQAMADDMPAAQIVAWFAGRTPQTGIGKIRLGLALIATGQVAAGRDLIRSAWASYTLQADQEDAIVRDHSDILTPELQRQRLSALIWHEDISGAKRQMSRAPDDAQRVAEARLTLRINPRAGVRMARLLPHRFEDDPGLLFDLAHMHHARGEDDDAATLLLRAAKTPATDYPDKWWAEFNAVARAEIEDKKYRTAYSLASQTGLTSGKEFAEAEFLAGWIALRFLGEAKTARTHFEHLDNAVTRPISRSRAHYWEGRANEALGDAAAAWRQYRQAADLPDTFYGQLALAHIEASPVLHLRDTDPGAAIIGADYENRDIIRAIKILADLGEESFLRVFVVNAVNQNGDAAHVAFLGHLLITLGFPEGAVRAAKTSGYNDVPLLAYSHPLIAVPAYQGPGTAPEPALVLGLIRQETEFDPVAVSKAGALGIMQMMPASARKMASIAGLPYRESDVLYDTKYNMQLGQTELQKDIADWGGSYVLAIAAYNAGPSNVKKWLGIYGDPRTPGSDPLDWLETIPFSETRNYVQRVLENTEVYRNRLAGGDQPLRILTDLYRPNAPQAKLLAYTPPPEPALRHTDAAAAATEPKPKPALDN